MADAESILIVDDTPENLRLLSRLLSEQGYRVRAAPDGAHALATMEKELPDLVLLDVMMPAMDGYEVCRRLKEQPETREVPVIFLSALDDVADKVRALEAGGVDYVAKPFQSEEVLARIETHLVLRKAQRSLAQQNDQLVVLGTLSRSLQSCQREEDTYTVFTAAAAELCPDTRGTLLVAPAGGDEFLPVGSWGSDSRGSLCREELDEALAAGRVLSSEGLEGGVGQSLRVGTSEGDGGTLLVPIGSPDDVMGILALRHDDASGDRATGCIELVGIDGTVVFQLLEHYALSLRNLRLQDRLRLEAIVDPLTGLFNRRHMEAVVEREAYRARRREKAVGLLMFDIDRFKAVNDTHGHEAGDRVLKHLGGLLREGTRGEDIACRYGGEEFLLILPEIDPDALRRRAEGFLARARESAVDWNGASLGFSLSAGMALWSGDAEFETAIRAADVALYRAKAAGRDRAVGP